MDHGLVWQRFGARVRELSKAVKLSQEEVAPSCGHDRSYFGAIERDERNLGLVSIHWNAGVL